MGMARRIWAITLVLAALAGQGSSSGESRRLLVVSSPMGGLGLDPNTGSIIGAPAMGRRGYLLYSGSAGLWSAKMADGSVIRASQYSSRGPDRVMRFTAARDGGSARLAYTGPELDVTVIITGTAQGFAFSAVARPHQSVLMELACPARLQFDPSQVNRVVCPQNGNNGVGFAFKRAFFNLLPVDHPVAWQNQPGDGSIYGRLAGGGPVMRPVTDPPVPVRLTDQGRALLTQDEAAAFAGGMAVVNRPSEPAQCDRVLANSDNGAWITGSRLGGSGMLWRVGGLVSEQSGPLSAAVLGAEATRAAAAGNGTVAVLAMANGPTRGGWAWTSADEWETRIRQVALRTGKQVRILRVESPSAMLGLLKSGNASVILNPYGEWVPCTMIADHADTVQSIGRYVQSGGVWIETGGFSLYAPLTPARRLTYETPYPAGFADFLHLDSTIGSAALYGVQPLPSTPWIGAKDHGKLFVPARVGCGSDDAGPYLARTFGTYVAPGSAWRAPTVRLALGVSARLAIAEYCRANGIDRPLSAKMPPAVLDRFRRSILLYLAGSARAKQAALPLLPGPTLLHFADFLHGGFDKEYPDHLPPIASFGTQAELLAMTAAAQRAGHLVMPYTNPTWWCDHPRGPTFARWGDSPLLKGLDGKPQYEIYGRNDGWTVCHWHPAVQAANRLTMRQFTRDIPMDMIFQDQNGARSWSMDMNPASPTPYAYADGLLSQVAEDARQRPLSTEAGWDRVSQFESQLCGMGWETVPTEGGPDWVRLTNSRFPAHTWEVYPLAQAIAHDKASMILHNLGQFVTNDRVLSWVIGLGFSPSYAMAADELRSEAPHEWLAWLSRLQQSVCGRYTGKPLGSFTHTQSTGAVDGSIEATYGDVHVRANLTAAERKVGPDTIPGYGFTARAPGLAVGPARSPGGSTDERAWSVSETSAGATRLWVYARPGAEVSVETPGPAPRTARLTWSGGGSAVATGSGNRLRLKLPSVGSEDLVQPPAALAALPPAQWPARPAICVISLPPTALPAWSAASPAEWLDAVRQGRAVRELGAQVRAITSAAGLAAALEAPRTEVLAIINPYGEGFPAEPGKWREMLGRIARFVRTGGTWMETGGYSFHTALVETAGEWQAEPVGPSGLATFGIPIGGGPVEAGPEPLAVTEEGLKWFDADLVREMNASSSPANRCLSAGRTAPPHLSLVTANGKSLFGCYRLQGWGGLFRFGGLRPPARVALQAGVGAIDHLYSTRPQPATPAGVRSLFSATLAR